MAFSMAMGRRRTSRPNLHVKKGATLLPDVNGELLTRTSHRSTSCRYPPETFLCAEAHLQYLIDNVSSSFTLSALE